MQGGHTEAAGATDGTTSQEGSLNGGFRGNEILADFSKAPHQLLDAGKHHGVGSSGETFELPGHAALLVEPCLLRLQYCDLLAVCLAPSSSEHS